MPRQPLYPRLYIIGVSAIAILALSAAYIQNFYLRNVETQTQMIELTFQQRNQVRSISEWRMQFAQKNRATIQDDIFLINWLKSWDKLKKQWLKLSNPPPRWSAIIKQIDEFEDAGILLQKEGITLAGIDRWIAKSPEVFSLLRQEVDVNITETKVHLKRLTEVTQTLLLILFIVLLVNTLFVFQPMQRDLNERMARFRAALYGSLDAVYFLDAYRDESGQIIDFIFRELNQKGEELIQMKREELIGGKLCELRPINRTGGFFEKYKNVVETGKILEEEFPIADRWFRHQIVPVLDGIAISSRDITLRKKAEMTLWSTDKMKSLGEMASSIAHEINNPLTIITGRATQVLAKLKHNENPDPTVVASIEKIESTAYRIAKIVKSLRSFSKDGERVPKTPHLVKTILDDTLELCRERFHSHQVELRVELVPAVWILCSPVQISQSLLNLLNNAFDAVLESDAPRWIALRFIRNEGRIRILVLDSGPGVPASLIDKIMMPFYTTKEVGKGTGLGLSIAKTLVEANQGQLRVETNYGHTCFSMEFPEYNSKELIRVPETYV